MVHAIMPFSEQAMMEASQSVQQCMSVVSVQAEGSIVTKARPKTHRRHHSLLSNASSTIDHLDHPSARMERSSNNGNALRKSVSARLNPQGWKLGDFWSQFRHGKELNAAESISLSTFDAISVRNMSAEKSDAKQRKTEISCAGRFDQTGTREAPNSSLRDWSGGELRRTHQNEKGINHVSTENDSIQIPNTTSDFAYWISSSRHLEFVSSNDSDTAASTSESQHLESFNVFTCYKFSSSGYQDDSPPERLGQLESCNAPLSSRWREIQGAKNWNGLLDPLDLDLRKEILRYGDFAQMTYDNFECEARSKYAGSAKFQKQKMFEKLHKQDNGYQVTRYLYATCENPLPSVLQSSLSSERWDVESNWMGYVAVATDMQEIERLGRRDIVVAWRGTVRTIEWLVDAEIQMAPVPIAAESSKVTEMCPKVEKGFWSLYTCKRSTSQFNQKSASEQVTTELTRLLTLYKGENLSITLTGHSLGGALAILTAYEIAERGLNKRQTSLGAEETIPVTVFTFGSPHVGNAVFRKKFEEMHLKALRVVEVYDLVPKTMKNIYFPWMEAYKHVGVELHIDHKLSTYLKHTRDPVDWHSLECYLHLVDGHQGLTSKNSRRFELVTGRDYALVNKHADILQERYCVPPKWWQVENKGLEISAEGRWIEPNRVLEDTPSRINHERFI